MIFDAYAWQRMARLFRPDAKYPGYKPNIREFPNGDGKVDAEKRYLHIAQKYNPPEWAVDYLARAHWEACKVAEAMDVPAEFYPRAADGALRVLEYPPGAGSVPHTDFDLFTVLCYRSSFVDLWRAHVPTLDDQFPGIHIGELGELVGLGDATPHSVPGRDYWQRSIVYFAVPNKFAELPSGQRVGMWLAERLERSRVEYQ